METIRLEDLTKSEVCFVYSTIGYIKGQLCSKYVGEINNYQTKMSICNDVNDLLCQLTSQDYLVSDNNMLSYAELSLDKTIEYLDRKNVKMDDLTDKMILSMGTEYHVFVTFYLYMVGKDEYVKVETDFFEIIN
jgi:hypothetical protein|nr:MAG TPA: hypothetical protein [Caudoviricetes sp.]